MAKNKKITIAYVDYKRKTKSTDFFMNLLKKSFSVEHFFYEDSYDNISVDYLNEFNVVIFFQLLPPLSYLRRITSKIVWIPMYDGMDRLPFTYIYLRLMDVSVISFTKRADKLMKLCFLNTLNVSFYPMPISTKKTDDKSIFFWIRNNQVNWSTFKKLFPPGFFSRVVIKINPDSCEKIILPSNKDVIKYKIELINGWLPRRELENKVNSCSFFLQPRLREGIGMAYLEAMSRGICVISPDKSSMNEYIQNNFNGFLYNPYFPKKLQIDNIERIRINLSKFNEIKYAYWKDDEKEILKYMLQKKPKYNFLLTIILFPLNMTKLIYIVYFALIKFLRK